jgi:glycosyltransferase involved in cell wall biosynthesis
MRIAYIAAGAAGMYCGSCIHDNTLAAALGRLGHEVALVPTYTPLRTDEDDVSSERVFYGAVNVYLESKLRWFRRMPGVVHWLLDRPALIGWASRFAGSTDPRELGRLTLDVLAGEQGPQRGELERLVSWLAAEFRPEVVHITNSMLVGMARRMRQDLAAAIVVAFQGEDLFLDDLPEPFKTNALAEIARRSADVDSFIAPSRYYADEMSRRLGIPEKKIRVVPLGLDLDGHSQPLSSRPDGDPLRLGFLARISPEKGFHRLVDAFIGLAGRPGLDSLELHAAGYLGAKDRPYFEAEVAKLARAGLAGRFVHHGEIDRERKIDFFRSLDVFSVPTVYREAKGLSVLEAIANGVPVVEPRHGSFPEMLAATGGGLLVEPDSPEGLIGGLDELLTDAEKRQRLGAVGRATVLERFGAEPMAASTLTVYEAALRAAGSRPS